MSFTRQLTRREGHAARRILVAARLSRAGLKRKPGRPPKALALAAADSRLHVGLHVSKDSTNKPKAGQKKTAKAASNEGASTTTGRRRGRPPGSKDKSRVGHAVMQKAQAKAMA
eukprot:349584-Chlamydomonas_euryale.AAC.2